MTTTMETTKDKMLSVRLAAPTAARLVKEAAREALRRGERVTMSDVVRDLVERGLEERAGMPA